MRKGIVEYDKDTNTICFLHSPDANSEDYFYWFPFNEIQTHDQYNQWFEHLGRKRWFTSEVKHDLVDVLESLGQYGNSEGCVAPGITESKEYQKNIKKDLT